MRHPIRGLGLGSEHRGVEDNPSVDTHFVHNAFIMLWMKLGIVPLLFLVWCLIRYIKIGLRSLGTSQDVDFRSVQVGLFSTVGIWIVTLNVGPTWPYYRETCLMALIAAIVVRISMRDLFDMRGDECESQSSSVMTQRGP